MITPDLKNRLAKIYELVKRGGTDGEKQAAQKALDKLLSKYNLKDIDLDSLELQQYAIKYSSDMEVSLIERIVLVLLDNENALKSAGRRTIGCKEVVINLTYFDYITLSASYEYFRRHMKAQWLKLSRPSLRRCRTAKTRKKRLDELRSVFFSNYVIASKLYKDGELRNVDSSKMTVKEQTDRYRMRGVEGGSYNRQVTNGLLLEK